MAHLAVRVRMAMVPALCLLALTRPASALPAVQKGTDYLQTQLGSFFDFPDLGPVQFMGCPSDPSMPTVDTMVRRLEDGAFGDGSVRIQTELVQLSLMSVAPVMVGDSFFDVFVEVAANTRSLGFMDINLIPPVDPDQPAGGSYDSFFDVFVDITIIPCLDELETPAGGITTPGNQIVMPDFHLGGMTAHGLWSSMPSPGTLLVPGAVGDPFANWHPGRTGDQFDFFPLGEIVHSNEGGTHRGTLAVVPEPGSLALLGLGLLGFVRRRGGAA